MTNLRTDRDIVTIKRTISLNYDKFRTLGLFYQERNEVLDRIASMGPESVSSAADECRDGGVRWRNFATHLRRIEKELIGEKELLDASQTEEKAFQDILGKPVSDFVSVHREIAGVSVSFDITGTFDVLTKSNRNGVTEIRNLGVSPETRFTLVNELNPFWEDRYSVSLKSRNVSFALAAENPKTGVKGSCCAKFYLITDNSIIIDDLSKYMDVGDLILWINP
jgi:hypothetical protein